MKFNLFNKKPVHLYDHLKPKDRIDTLMTEYLSPILEPEGYTYLKSKRAFKKKGAFFDFHISWHGSKNNEGNTSVEFDITVAIYAPKYRKWEKEFYQLDTKMDVFIDGSGVNYVKGWSKEYFKVWYDLVEHDNRKLMKAIVENVKQAGFDFFNNYTSFDLAIEKLKEYPIKNLEKIVDFYILQDKWQEAYDFFENNREWHDEQEQIEGNDPNSYYSVNRKTSFELRQERLKNWRQNLK